MLRYLQRKAAAEVKDMKKEAEKKRNVRPSELAIHYLYILSLDGRKLDPAATYLLQNMAERTGEFTIYGKARAAVVLASCISESAATPPCWFRGQESAYVHCHSPSCLSC